SRGEGLAVWAERNRRDGIAVPPENGETLATGHVPQPDRRVVVCRSERLAVRAEHDRPHGSGSSQRGRRLLGAGGEVPEPDSLVPAPEARSLPSGLKATEAT